MNIGRKGLTWSLTWARRIVVAIVGFTVLLIGIALLVLPGPAFLVIPLGLAILATEFVWARSLLQKARAKLVRRGKGSAKQPDKQMLMCLMSCATLLLEVY
jgi:uncharacterized protein (TIGR02611 family)